MRIYLGLAGVSAALFASSLFMSGLAAAPGSDPGRRLFLQCQACHSVTAGAPHKVGPNLHGTLNARAATRPGYSYSPALKRSNVTWDNATLDRFLARPAAVVPGTKMVFSGVPNPRDRQLIIDYMRRTTR